MSKIEKEEIKTLIRERGLTITDVVDAVIERWRFCRSRFSNAFRWNQRLHFAEAQKDRKSEMKKFRVSTNWKYYAEIEVEAETEEAAYNLVSGSSELPDGTYFDDSFQIDSVEEITKAEDKK